MSLISIDEFKRVEIRVGKVLEAERLKGTDRIIKLKVSFGDRTMQALTGLGHLYEPEHFVGKLYAFVTNLQPKKLRGEVSECMILAAVESEERIAPLVPESHVREGSEVTQALTHEPYKPSEDTFLLEDALDKIGEKRYDVAIEVGCGPGYLLSSLAEKAWEVIGVDIQYAALAEARRRIGEEWSRTHLIQADTLTCLRPSTRYSILITNPPYLPADSEFHDETIHGGPTGAETLVRILEEARRVMRGSYKAIAVVSSLTDTRPFEDMGFKIAKLASHKLFFEELLCLEITPEETPDNTSGR